MIYVPTASSYTTSSLNYENENNPKDTQTNECDKTREVNWITCLHND